MTTLSGTNWRASAEKQLILLREMRRRQCRNSLETWCTEALAPLGHKPAAHHKLLIAELEAVARGETQRLMVCMPPGSAKSTYGSVLFPPWFLAQAPDRKLIACSHTMELAEGFGRLVRNTIADHSGTLGYGISADDRSAARWSTTNGSMYYAAGVGGAIGGRRSDLAIIDDPVKSREDAESPTIQERNWHWFTADLRTRLRPNARIVLIMTRWSEDDLGGRLLATQGDRWRVISLPATARENDPLGRAPGELLWSDDAYGYAGEIAKVRSEYEQSGAMRDWWSLYEQNPRPAEGALFKTGQVSIFDAAPAGRNIVRAWDLAATAQTGTRDPDWTAGVKMLRLDDGRLVVLDVVRVRGGPDEVEATIVNSAKQDGAGVRVGLPQDPGQAGKVQVQYLTRKLMGYRVESGVETGDKSTRAAPLASQANVGNVSLVRGAWNRAFLDELGSFPSGTHDDQVDAASRAFSMIGMRAPMTFSPEFLARI